MNDILKEMSSADSRLVAGRWHRDRLAWGGRFAEARVALQALRGFEERPKHKFLIIGRARSGTTLLTRLLNAQPEIACAGELLVRHVWAPVSYLDRIAQKSRYDVWGAKFLSYQMVQVHRLKDPVAFLRDLEGRGFRFIHLVRATLPQTLSLYVAQTTKRFHSDRTSGAGPQSVRLDPEDFLGVSVGQTRFSAARDEFSGRSAPPYIV